MNRRNGFFLSFLISVLIADNVIAEPTVVVTGRDTKASYFQPVTSSNPNTVYWGDTHVHTNLSVDAYNYGNRTLGPEAAYRFARGETVTTNNGITAQLDRPLDFLVVADHASNMGVIPQLRAGNKNLLSTELGGKWLDRLNKINSERDPKQSAQFIAEMITAGFTEDKAIGNNAFKQEIWTSVATLADQHNIPGRFTAFIGYEWTSVNQDEASLHRVVIFKDAADKTTQVLPFSQYSGRDPEALWAYMADYERKTAGEVLAIPHNSNLSKGAMFALTTMQGNTLSTSYAKARSRWEPLLEVTQIKGDSEVHPDLSPNDAFADFETLPPRQTPTRTEHEYSYARSALKQGLKQHTTLGVNPFKFGMIGSTDSHTSLATADESNFFGKLSFVEPNASRMLNSWRGPFFNDEGWFGQAWRMNAAGYAAVWAQENTRESLFAAMKRKEVYATTGPRMTVRFFGGWDYQASDAFSPDLPTVGYEKGVPMGGDLSHAPENQPPQFLIRAVKDPSGANLDRIQVIKGWHDAKGQLHENVYDVVLSDHRKPNWRGKVKAVGNTVDIPSASYTNTIGDPELAVVWTDPDFDKDELAFYYVRVLEIPTPRWTAYDAKYFGLQDLPTEIPMVTQERAYTSPIWYSPVGI